MTRRRRIAIAGGMAAAAALTLGGVAPAQATYGGGIAEFNWHNRDCPSNVWGNWAAFVTIHGSTSDDGNFLSVIDQCADGHSAVAEWKLGPASSKERIRRLWDHDGAHNAGNIMRPSPHNGSRKLSFRACVGHYNTRAVVKCSKWVTIR